MCGAGGGGCSVKDAKAEASAAPVPTRRRLLPGRRRASLTPTQSATARSISGSELRAKRGAALAEPAPAKPLQLNERRGAEGAAASVGYFSASTATPSRPATPREVRRHGDAAGFCKSTIDDASSIHEDGPTNGIRNCQHDLL